MTGPAGGICRRAPSDCSRRATPGRRASASCRSRVQASRSPRNTFASAADLALRSHNGFWGASAEQFQHSKGPAPPHTHSPPPAKRPLRMRPKYRPHTASRTWRPPPPFAQDHTMAAMVSAPSNLSPSRAQRSPPRRMPRAASLLKTRCEESAETPCTQHAVCAAPGPVRPHNFAWGVGAQGIHRLPPAQVSPRRQQGRQRRGPPTSP